MYRVLPDNFPRPLQVLGPEWMSPDLRPYRLATIYILGFIVTLLVWTLGRQIILHTLFLVRINYLKCVPSAHLYFLRFRLPSSNQHTWGIRMGSRSCTFWPSLPHQLRHITDCFSGPSGNGCRGSFILADTAVPGKATGSRYGPSKHAGRRSQRKIGFDIHRPGSLFLIEEQMAKQATDLSLAVGLRYLGYLLTAFVIPVLIAIISTLVTKYLETGTK